MRRSTTDWKKWKPYVKRGKNITSIIFLSKNYAKHTSVLATIRETRMRNNKLKFVTKKLKQLCTHANELCHTCHHNYFCLSKRALFIIDSIKTLKQTNKPKKKRICQKLTFFSFFADGRSRREDLFFKEFLWSASDWLELIAIWLLEVDSSPTPNCGQRIKINTSKTNESANFWIQSFAKCGQILAE